MSFFGSLFKDGKTLTLSSAKSDTSESSASNNYAISIFAIFTVIEQIANIMSTIEYKTYKNGEEVKGYEWHSLNIKPNKNQSSTEFWTEAICNLLYSGELLIVETSNGQKIIADSFVKEDKAVIGCYFSHVSRGTYTFNNVFPADEVIYIKYNDNNTINILSSIFYECNNLYSAAVEKYKHSGGEKGVLEISAVERGKKDFSKTYSEIVNNRFKSYFQAKSAVMPLYEGFKYVPSTSSSVAKNSNEISDIKNIFDEAITRTAQAYKISPQLIKGDIAGIDEAINYSLMCCIDPLANAISEELTGKKYSASEIIKGNYIDADTSCIKHIDIFSLANNIEKLIGSGFMSINEIRIKSGQAPIMEEWADKFYITKNFEEIENATKNKEGNK